MQNQDRINKFYNDNANEYAHKYLDELSHKHLDRIILREFASVSKDKGMAVDFGCGPGQTTKYLYENGLNEIIGIDISSAMIQIARSLHPQIRFEEGNLLSLRFPDKYFSAAIAFYAIINLDYDQLEIVFAEINHVLKEQAQFLLSFHTGNEKIHLDDFEGKKVDIDFYLFNTDKILEMLNAGGFRTITAYERYPYPIAEYPSKRAYLWMEKM